ncbi:hypothetical protein BSKO_07759 [Bryopsis sp. KO-2023]|nr:hypothetical protein BSKO_07759 [Bryopsis sp. KO-2023]
MVDMAKRGKRDWRAVLEDSLKAENLESFLFKSEQETEERFGKEGVKSKEVSDSEASSSEDEEGGNQLAELASEKSKERKPAWEDEDDIALKIDVNASRHGRGIQKASDGATLTGVQYERRLRDRHMKLHPRTSWAQVKSRKSTRKRRKVDSSDDEAGINGSGSGASDADDPIDEILTSANVHLGKHKTLPAQQIELSRLLDANRNERTFGFINSIEFHPENQLMLTCGGKDKRVHLFNVDGVENPKMQTVHFNDMRVVKAAFSPSGHQITVSGGGNKHCYVYDIEASTLQKVQSSQRDGCPHLVTFTTSKAPDVPLAAFHGTGGTLPLLCMKSKQWVGTLKMNTGNLVESAVFSRDGKELYSAGSGGTVHVWDLRMRRCRHRWNDDGALKCTSMALSPQEHYMAVGSEMGAVNLYNFDDCRPSGAQNAPAPIKTLLNLTTRIDDMQFNSDAQILAIASQRIPGSLRLVHMPSRTVFKNWPTMKTPLEYVSRVAFSPGGAFFAAGNSKGRVLLYRLHHYGTV